MEINGKNYEIVKQTQQELDEDGVCAGCIAKGNESLCEQLGECYNEFANYKFIEKN